MFSLFIRTIHNLKKYLAVSCVGEPTFVAMRTSIDSLIAATNRFPMSQPFWKNRIAIIFIREPRSPPLGLTWIKFGHDVQTPNRLTSWVFFLVLTTKISFSVWFLHVIGVFVSHLLIVLLTSCSNDRKVFNIHF